MVQRYLWYIKLYIRLIVVWDDATLSMPPTVWSYTDLIVTGRTFLHNYSLALREQSRLQKLRKQKTLQIMKYLNYMFRCLICLIFSHFILNSFCYWLHLFHWLNTRFSFLWDHLNVTIKLSWFETNFYRNVCCFTSLYIKAVGWRRLVKMYYDFK